MEELYFKIKHLPTGLYYDTNGWELVKEHEVSALYYHTDIKITKEGFLVFARVNGKEEILNIPGRCFEIILYKLTKI